MTCWRVDAWSRLVLDLPHGVHPLFRPEEEEATIDRNAVFALMGSLEGGLPTW